MRSGKTKTHSIGRYQEIMGYLFITPPMLLFLIFTVIPALRAFYLSFTNYDILTKAKWIGISNYKRLLGDELFWQTLVNIVNYVIFYIPGIVIISLLLALLLNRKLKGMTAYRTLYYIPGLTSTIGAATVWMWLLNPEYGIINQILGYFGIVGPAWLANSSTAMLSIVIVTLWQGLGGNIVVYLAGLQGIPEYLYESARLDGARSHQLFRYIIWPGLRPTTFFITTMSLIGSFQLFDQSYAMTQGGPGNSTKTPVYLIYNSGFNELHMGYASTMAFVLFLIIMAVSLVNMKINEKNSLI